MQTPRNCTRQVLAINRGRSPMSTVVIVTNATVSFTSVYILLAAKTTVLLQEQSQITFFFFFLKNSPCENQNNMLSYICNIMFIESVQDFFAIFFSFIFRKSWRTCICTKVHFFVVIFFPVHDLKPGALHC